MAGLILYGSTVADSTLTSANDLATSSGGAETTVSNDWGGTGHYGELYSSGGTSLPSSNSVPATPSGHGWIFYVGPGNFALGNWTATFAHAALDATIPIDFTIRFFKYSSGAYTPIGSIAINPGNGFLTRHVFTFPATAMASVAFDTPDYLYIDLWEHDATGIAGGDTGILYLSTSSTAGVIDDLQVVTSDFAAGAGSGIIDPTIFGSATADATITTACDVAPTTGGVETSKVSAYTTGTGNYGEMYSKGNATAPTFVTVPAAPQLNGWVYRPGAGTFIAGNWSATITAATGNNLGTWNFRVFSHIAGTYALVGTLTAAITGTTKVTYTFSAVSFPAVTLGAADWMYFDLWYQDTSGLVSGSATIYESVTAISGVASDMQINTSSFTPASTGPKVQWYGRPLLPYFLHTRPAWYGHPLTGYLATPHTIPGPARSKDLIAVASHGSARSKFLISAGHLILGLSRSTYKAAIASKQAVRARFLAGAVSKAQARARYLEAARSAGSVRAKFLGSIKSAGAMRSKFTESIGSAGRARSRFIEAVASVGRARSRFQSAAVSLGRARSRFLSAISSKAQSRSRFLISIGQKAANRAKYLISIGEKSANRAKYLISVAQRANNRAKFLISIKSGANSRARYLISIAEKGRARARDLISVASRGWNESKFKIQATSAANAIVGLARSRYLTSIKQAGSTHTPFKIAAVMRGRARSIFQSAARSSVQSRARFQSAIKLVGKSRARFIVSLRTSARALTRFLIQGVAAPTVPFKSATHAVTQLLNSAHAITTSLSMTRIIGRSLLIAELIRASLSMLVGRVSALSITHQETAMPAPFSTILSTITVTDVNNALVSNASVVTLLVSYADLTSTGFSLGSGITNIGSGQYQAKYNSKASGQIRELWFVTAADGLTVATAQFEVGIGF